MTDPPPPQGDRATWRLPRWKVPASIHQRNLLIGAGLGVLALAMAFTAHQHGRPVTAALLALFSVTVIGALLGVRAGVIAGIVASVAYNLLLTEPILTFTVPTADDLLPIVALNVCAIASGVIAGRLRDRAIAAERAGRLVTELLAFSQALQPAISLEQIEKVAEQHIGQGTTVRLFIDVDGQLSSPSSARDGADLAQHAWSGSTSEVRAGDRLALVLGSDARRFGVLIVDARRDRLAGQDIRKFLPLLALAVQRSLLAAELSEADAVKRSEQFKTALLSSVSHDLRTPLAAISASASSLTRFAADLDTRTKEQLLQTIQEQCARLDRLTTNLLNIGRIEGGLELDQMPVVDAVEVLGSALGKVRQLHVDHRFEKDLRAGTALVRADEALLEQVFLNVLENAAVHTSAGTRIKVSAAPMGRLILFSIEDDGCGIAEQHRGRVFERFVQGKRSSGSGLGLSIAKGFTERIGGTITAGSASPPLKGAKIEIALPVVEG